MGVVIIDGSTVRALVDDEVQYGKCAEETFNKLDLNGDGVLSRAELRRAFETMRLIETHFGVDAPAAGAEQLRQLYDSIFDKFDLDRSGTVDLAEFKDEMKKILVAIADGLGSSPIQMALEDDVDGGQSFLQRAADLEEAKLRKSQAQN